MHPPVLMAALALVANGSCVSAKLNMTCPDPLPLAQALADKQGWLRYPRPDNKARAYPQPKSHRLASMQVYSDHPSEGAALVSSADRPLASVVRESTWQIAEEHWIACT